MTKAEIKLKQLLEEKFENDSLKERDADYNIKFRQWFLQQFSNNKDQSDTCGLEEFAVYFLNTVRQQTKLHLSVPENIEVQPTKCQTPVRTIKATSNANSSTPVEAESTPDFHRTRDASSFGAASMASICRSGVSLEQSSFSKSLHNDASTPVRRPANHEGSMQRRSGNSFQTPKSNERQFRSSSASSSLCLGDFLVINTSTRSGKKKTPQSQTTTETPTGKPKKRVVPTTLSARTTNAAPFGSTSSAFSNENNILKIADSEIVDKDKCSIMAARKSLKLNASEISRELGASASVVQLESKILDISSDRSAVSKSNLEVLPPLDFDKLTECDTLQRLAVVYALLVDLNFTTNVLNEISFILNLLNASEPQAVDTAPNEEDKSDDAITSGTDGACLLRNYTNCAYFALRVLEQLSHLLVQLDVKSLGVLLNCERFSYLTSVVKLQLQAIYQRKQQIELRQKSLLEVESVRFEKSQCKNVYYQENKDSRQHFVSNNDFGAFKTQRDLFYKTLKHWESNHLNPTWDFQAEIAPKIREIFRQSENPINMAHFAKLFVGQLLISANDATSPEEIGLDDIDLQKFSKLAQRLVAPSQFSVDYQFPRHQAFFRDFIEASRSSSFAEQLKMALYSELITRNDSTFEQLNLHGNDKDDDEDEAATAAQDADNELVVHPEVLATMLTLAKFLGYVTAQPFNQNAGAITGNVAKKQIALRNLFQPSFDLCRLLKQAIKNGKLLITLPWLVQYLAMLDNVSLQLENMVATTEVMFALYANLVAETTKLQPAAIFIVRCCLGWLFETKPIIAEQYYAYRLSGNATQPQTMAYMQQVQLLASGKLAEELSANAGLVISDLQRDQNGVYVCVLKQQDAIKQDSSLTISLKDSTTDLLPLNPLLESTLSVACPFLADFRVSIMPAKYAQAKYVSRTGRYRHITTRLAELTPLPTRHQSPVDESTNPALASHNTIKKKQQGQLIEAFLHSQNASMRRLIEFIIERAYKSVVKDVQHKILLPSKAAADAEVNEINSYNRSEVSETVTKIYKDARAAAMVQWQATVPQMLDERIENALNALLSEETTPIIKKTYFQLIRRNAAHKISSWRHANMIKNNFYCPDLNEMILKICKANKRVKPAQISSELQLITEEPSVSELIDDLQYWLHCTSMRPELLQQTNGIIEYLERLPTAFVNTLPSIFYRLIGAGIIQLLQHLIDRHPLLLTTELVSAACNVWLRPEMQAVVAKKNNTDNADSLEEASATNVSYIESGDREIPSIYDGLITVSFIESLDTIHSSYAALKLLLVEMIKQRIITVDDVNTLFVPIFKEDWPADVLNEISKLLRSIAQETANIRALTGADVDIDDGKSHLFMEVLADFAKDVDDF